MAQVRGRLRGYWARCPSPTRRRQPELFPAVQMALSTARNESQTRSCAALPLNRLKNTAATTLQ